MTTQTITPSEEKRTCQLVLNVPSQLDGQEDLVRRAIAAALYKKGTLTMKEACDLIGGGSRREFEENILPSFGYAMMDDLTEEELETELNAIRAIT